MGLVEGEILRESRTVGAALVLLTLTWGQFGVASGRCLAAAEEVERGGVTWLDSEAGFEKATKERTAICILITGPESAGLWSQLESGFLKSASTRKLIARCVPVLVEGKPSETVRRLLGEVGKEPMLVLLDFRQQIIQRWTGAFPERREFAKHAKHGISENARVAASFKKGETALRKIKYAIEIKKYRQAVETLIAAEALQLPPDDDLTARLGETRKKLEAEWGRRHQEAKDLEEKRSYTQAVTALEALLRDLPFPERDKLVRRDITRLWSLINP